jgi:hypothetical protein
MPWEEFEGHIRRTLRLGNEVLVKDIVYLVKDSQNAALVSKDKWEYLLKWYTPLRLEPAADGWTFQEILEIVGQS